MKTSCATRSIKLATTFVLLVASLTWRTLGGEPPSSGVIYINHARVAAGGTLIQTNNFKVMTLRRDRAGEVEIHERDTDIFHVLDGSATFVTGGKAVDARPAGAGELRGKAIVGGEEHHLSKGDVLVIPHGVPHWFKAVDGTIDYFVVKVSQ